MPKPLPANYLAGTTGDDTLDIRGNNNDFTVNAAGGNDTIYGGNGQDSLYGGGGADLIYASVEDMIVDGGSGVDSVSFLYFSDASGAGVSARLMGGLLGLQQDGVAPRANVLANVENLFGSSYADYLGGNRSINKLDGGAGNDWLLAWGSGDFLTGGTGADTFDLSAMGSGTVTITDFHYNDGDRIRIEGGANFSWVSGFSQDANGSLQPAWIGTCDVQFGGTLEAIVLGADTAPSANWIIGSGIAPVYGTEGDDTLTGGPGVDDLRGLGGNDLLDGGAGADTMYGGSGNDRYLIDNSADLAVESIGAGDDWAITSVSYALADGTEIETLSTSNAESTAALSLIGNAYGQSIYGNAGANVINGGGGNDYLIGVGGSDRFVFTGTPGNDAIADFTSGSDKLDLIAFGITMANVTATSANGNTSLAVDSNQDGTADFTIMLVGSGAPLAGDYLF